MDGSRTMRGLGSRTERGGGGGGMGESTRRPLSASGAMSARGPSNGGGLGEGGGHQPLSSKNWQYRPVVTKREGLPPTQMPDRAEEGDVPPLWSTNVWGDVRRARTNPMGGGGGKRPRSGGGGGSAITLAGSGGGGGMGPGDAVAIAVAAKETELKKKLAAFASFNQTERDLLQMAFARVGQEHGGVPGLASRGEFSDVFDRLGVRLSPAEVSAMFRKYGEDKTGRMPVDLFVTAVLESRNRIIAMEERRVGAYKAGKRDEYGFNGRIKYFPCRRGVYAPTDWDPALAARSAKPPKAGLSLEFVYGYGGLTNNTNNLYYNSADHIVYYTAAVGVVYDRHNHRQHFFFGHDDDIKCAAMHPNMHLVATGQVASTSGPPIACVWDTRINPDGSVRGRVAQLPFPGAASVIALAFSSDGLRLVAVTGDVDHTVHVFDWAAADAALDSCGGGGKKGAAAEPKPQEVGTSPGLITIGKGGKGDSFPHVFGATWNPYGKSADGKAKDQWAEFVTYGAKHVKLWRLYHSKQDGQPYYGKLGAPGAAEPGKFSPTSSPVDVVSACWLPPRGAHSTGAPVLVTGTREGHILLFTTDKGLCCTRQLEAHGKGPTIPALSGGGVTHSGVRCLSLRADGETMVSGGGDGVVAWWSAATVTAAARTPSVPCTPHERRVLTGDDNATPPCVRGLDCHKYSSDVIVGTYRCEIWEIDDIDGPQVLIYGHSGDVRGLAVHPTEKHVFATASEAGRLFVWNGRSRVLRAKCNVRRACVGVGFSPDGEHVAVGCKDGTLVIISYTNLVVGEAQQVVKRPDGTKCEFHHCAEAIDEVKYSPDGHLLAAGSHDNFIDVYDVTGRAVPGRSSGVIYHRLHRLKGHSSYITHLDWSAYNPRFPDRRILQSTCGAYELLYWDGNTGTQVRQSMRDERWDTQTCTLGFSVMVRCSTIDN